MEPPIMLKELEFPFDSSNIIKKKKSLRRLLLSNESQNNSRIKKKIAILGGGTTNDIKLVLELFLLNEGIEPQFYESEYNSFYVDAVFCNDKLASFKPDIIYICTSIHNITNFPKISDDKKNVENLLENEFSKYQQIWDSIKSKYNVPIIQNNFELPYFRLLGNRDCVDYKGKVNFVNRLNLKFSEYAFEHKNLHIVDINYISSDYGLSKWSDPFYYYMYKYCLAVPAIPVLSFNVANVIKAIYGKNKKGLVLDLDNTLWGGVIGDEGIEGISLGQETSDGQAYQDFQLYLKELSNIGITLSICSKNDEKNALLGLSHPDSILRKDDFVQIKANWNNKDDNFKEIANTLNVSPDSLVFVDDNPVERNLVTTQLQGVRAPNLTDVSSYIYNIDRSGFFENISLSEEDLKRNEMYKSNQLRASLKSEFKDYGDYLDSLEMKAQIKPFEPLYYERISQLTNKSNQFNLTTLRLTENEIEHISDDKKYLTFYGKLTDKFGDNGIVSLVIGEIVDDGLHIRLWLMSCRVLKRDFELAMLDKLTETATNLKLSCIIGYYFKTEKNGIVSEFYGNHGFKKISEDDRGNTVWKNELKTPYKKLNHHIYIE